MNDDSRVLSQVRDWLDRGGLAFEMDVARRISKHAHWLTQGGHYTDPVSLLEREIDVTGYVRDHDDPSFKHLIKVIAECKATTGPWVLFAGPLWMNGPWEPVMGAEHGCAHCESISARLGGLQDGLPSAYSVTEKRANNSPDHAYEAFQQVTNATLAECKDVQGWSISHATDFATVFVFPIVVTQSPLVLCSLSSEGEIELTTTKMAEVAVRRTGLPVDDVEGLSVVAVNIDALDDLMSELASVGSACYADPA